MGTDCIDSKDRKLAKVSFMKLKNHQDQSHFSFSRGVKLSGLFFVFLFTPLLISFLSLSMNYTHFKMVVLALESTGLPTVDFFSSQERNLICP